MVVHLVGQLNDKVLSFLGPATTALAESGSAQTMVLIDSPRYRHLLLRLPPSVDLLLVRDALDPLTRWRRLRGAYKQILSKPGITAVHLHGFVPCILGSQLMRSMDLWASTYFSPHGSRSLGNLSFGGRALNALLRPFTNIPRQRVIASIGSDARALTDMTQQSVNLIESPVPDVYFTTPRCESTRPLVVASRAAGFDVRAVEAFVQTAVMLGGTEIDLSFHWMGTVDAVSAARLKAADVQVFDLALDADRAARLVTGWVYAAPTGGFGFSSNLTTAMACGLPCVVADTPHHRDIIKHGVTGFLCATEAEFLACLAQLVDDHALRARMGTAARADAKARFGRASFQAALRAAYQVPAS
jgi:glycosyltransferase involved in cell wall biosynthesis